MDDNTDEARFWLIDTRSIWNGTDIDDAAPEALRLLSEEEKTKARKFYFLKDAKLSVASTLLKRLFVRLVVGSPWAEIRFSRRGDATHGKPCYVLSDPDSSWLDFNVSHQAGLAALGGCHVHGDEIGIDIVCVNERDNQRMVENEGFDAFIDMHAEVFSDADVDRMKKRSDGQPKSSESFSDLGQDQDSLGARLRRFYAYWCIREAYVKMVGEGLLAPWIKEVEFRNVRVPRPTHAEPGTGSGIWGQIIEEIEVWSKDGKLEDVAVSLQAFEEHYMIATATRSSKPSRLAGHDFKTLSIENDILPFVGG